MKEQNIYDRIDLKLKEINTSRKKMCNDLKIPYSTLTSFYQNRSGNLTLSTAKKIADYLNCSIDFLVCGQNGAEVDLNKKQKEVIQNKINHGWAIDKIPEEFCLLYGEVSEAYEAYLKKKDDLGSELADIAIYLLGISEMLGFSLQEEIVKKMEINIHRKYYYENGVLKKVVE